MLHAIQLSTARSACKIRRVFGIVALLALVFPGAAAPSAPLSTSERIVEWTFESTKHYTDPFNDVEVDVVFSREGKTWRVPAFWRGERRWTVRFAPPTAGEYAYRLQSSDRSNPDLNGRPGRVRIEAYRGSNPLLRHGALKVSASKRYFEHADGTPFYWLGDTWWAGLSDRLSWQGFQSLTADRQAKGFTVIQLVAGLVPSSEERPPTDPGFCNEGGCVWSAAFERINPGYFDAADRRIQHLLERGLVPAIFGGWRPHLARMGVPKMKQHWRYIIARYGAYPVFWVVGGELHDPPPSQRRPGLPFGATIVDLNMPGWTEVAKYIRSIDPYRHPTAAHEIDPPFDTALQDDSLTDFDLFQAGHRGWPSIATEVALLNKHYARTTVTKPLVVGEVGYERLGETHFADFQRAAFWLGMLNGAAGHSYGAVGTWQTYGPDKLFQQIKFSFVDWTEGMKLPGSYQIGIGSKLLRRYRWWEFKPHPEWITPAGTTLLRPNKQVNGFDIDLIAAIQGRDPPGAEELPLGEWHAAHGTWRLPYAAGIPGKVRIIYLPYFGFKSYPTPTVHGLEPGICYRAFYWEPSLGIEFDLGGVSNSPASSTDCGIKNNERKLYDSSGKYRGELSGPKWSEYGKASRIEHGSYTPDKPPSIGDWILVLAAQHSAALEGSKSAL